MTAPRVRGPLRTAVWWVLGVAALAIAYAPAWRAPLYSDDFQLSNEMYPAYGGSYLRALTESWGDGWQPNRFNPTGRFFSFTFHFTMHDLAVRSGTSIQTWYRGAGLVMLIALAAAAAFALVAALRHISRANRGLGLSRAFAAVAIVIAITLQLHPWSTDGIISIFDMGIAAAVLSLVLMGLALRAVHSSRPLWQLALALGALAVVGVTFYETLVPAVAATALAYAWLFVSERRAGRSTRVPAVLFLVGVVLPALVFLAGRAYVATLDLDDYSGTDLELRPQGLRVFAYLSAGTVPGFGWPQSAATAGGMRITAQVVLAAFALLAVVVTGLVLARRRRAVVLNRRAWLVLAMFVLLVVLSYLSISFTEKYIGEISFKGAVYISYATGLAVTAIVLVGVALAVQPRVAERWGVVILPALGAWVVVQQAANWAAVDAFASLFASNSELSAAVVVWNPDEGARCDVLDRWLASPGALDLRDIVVKTANDAYAIEFGEPFCSAQG